MYNTIPNVIAKDKTVEAVVQMIAIKPCEQR